MIKTSLALWWNGRRKSVICKVVGLGVAIAVLQVGVSVSAQSAQSTASSSAPQGLSYALIPAGSRVTAPDFKLTDMNGKTLTLSEFRGKVVLLDFWAVNCGGCKVEIPWYVEFDHKYRDQGLRLIGIDMYGEKPELIRPFMAKSGMVYPVAVGDDALGPGLACKQCHSRC